MITMTTENQSNLDISLDPNVYNAHSLSSLQRIILGNDGTMTQLIENIIGERLEVDKLYEGPVIDADELDCFLTPEDSACQRRIVTLNGQGSGIPCLYADSLVFHDNLQVNFSRALQDSTISIGRAWEKYKVETYKVLQSWGFERATEHAQHFAISHQDLILYRTYFVYSGGKKIFRITEKFPVFWYQSVEQLYPKNILSKQKESSNEPL